ncbi:MAG TPA: hypothetical protein GXX28_01975 [Firmicutes bacterium]|nr:hypothetical protein [Bacillota bacterium]
MSREARERPFIDLHAHVLPGVDDGPQTLEEAVALLRLLQEDGVGTVVATPHVAPGFFWPYDPAQMGERVAALRQAAAAAGVGVEILSGAEVYLSPEIIPLAQARELPTLGDSRYILVEFPRREIPFWGFEVLQKLQRAGYRPILAHPELNDEVRADWEVPLDLARQGILLQVDAGSLVGRWGSHVAAYALKLCAAGLVQAVASDAHSRRRPPEMRLAWEVLERNLPGADPSLLFCPLSRDILHGQGQSA